MNTRKAILGLTGALLSVLTVSAENIEKQEWSITPYFWLPGMDVTSRIQGLPPADIELGFDDIIDNFDVFALSARAEYWWGQYGVVADGIWMDLKKDGLGPAQNADLQISDGVLDILAAYRFNLRKGGREVPSMRILFGGRYHYLKQELGGPLSTGGSEDWLEPVVAAQLVAPVSPRWLVSARADAGGFGVADASDITWSAMAGAGWRFAEKWIAKFGYRYYYIDYSTGSGLQAFGLEGNMHGPWIGISYGM
jgi:hypothetical protein